MPYIIVYVLLFHIVDSLCLDLEEVVISFSHKQITLKVTPGCSIVIDEHILPGIVAYIIFYLILPYYKVKYPDTAGSSLLRPDGSFNMEYWDSNGRGGKSAQNLYAEQPLVANYYGCSYIDVVNNCGISPVNIKNYYPSNDVHPSKAGYDVWGETVARLLTGK